jgi:PAS domain S-box-containing protein
LDASISGIFSKDIKDHNVDTACGKDTIEMEKNKNLLIGHSADIGGTGLEHLVNSIPGGIASYLIKEGRFIPTYFSDGVPALSGYTRDEFEVMTGDNALDIMYEADRERVMEAAGTALDRGNILDISYRIRHKNGKLIWVHLNGRRIETAQGDIGFYAVFTGMSAETRLIQSIANETVDGIYVIDKKTYELLYVKESKTLFRADKDCVGKKCYTALHGKESPCEFCTLKSHAPDGKSHNMSVGGTDRYYSTRFRDTDWNGIPAYVKYVQDVTEETRVQKEKERLEQYFQTLVKNLPGGVAVVRYKKDGSLVPEFLSDGFAAMTGMTPKEAWSLYKKNALNGVHPDDQERVNVQMARFVDRGENHCEITYRVKKGDGGYIWVKNTLTMIQNEGGEKRVYAGFHDMTKERNQQELLRQQFNELIMQHYREPGPNALIIGHCNITQNKILEIIDHTDSALFQTFGQVRETFFAGIGTLVVDEKERQTFLDTYLNAPSLAAFKEGKTELIQKCFVKLPKDAIGRYVQFKVNLVETPDTGDITGILTVTDITDQTISDRIMHQLSVASYDLVVDVDMRQDRYTILSGDPASKDVPQKAGRHSDRIAYMIREQVVPRDREQIARLLDTGYMAERLKKDSSYSFPYSIVGKRGDILTKNLTISATDLRLGRVCLARSDITESVREQQGMLNVVAYTFELLAFIKVHSNSVTMYTREIVLKNLPPYKIENYTGSGSCLAGFFNPDGGEVEEQFCLETMRKRLDEKPSGYDFVFPYQSDEGLRFKQVNVLWGDRSHKTVCLVRADVTDMLAAERRTKEALEKALALAEEANRAKSDFLSSMSHDIRTPMNAIMGMTALAEAHLDDGERVRECLRKISLSSRHLLSLVNDILDMSKIERSKITLNRMRISLFELVEQLADMMAPQAREAGLQFMVRTEDIRHQYFYGDSLRINQILINILSNAIKFTPEGGKVKFAVEEIMPVQNADRIRYRFEISDTGIGMPDEFLAHIFEPFTRNRSTARVEGTGLGLSITKGLVDLMEGMISVKSNPHKGTAFCVELECERASDVHGDDLGGDAVGADHANEIMLSGRCFLVAEDNAINAEILCELLQMQGARYVLKTDGDQAVKAFQSAEPGTFDAILMDIQMPGMNGYQATRMIRGLEREDAGKIPIIAMTANAFAEDILLSREAGMDAHVAKPIDMQVLWTTLSRLLGS